MPLQPSIIILCQTGLNRKTWRSLCRISVQFSSVEITHFVEAWYTDRFPSEYVDIDKMMLHFFFYMFSYFVSASPLVLWGCNLHAKRNYYFKLTFLGLPWLFFMFLRDLNQQTKNQISVFQFTLPVSVVVFFLVWFWF